MSDKIKTLSEAIRYGSTFIDETRMFFDDKDESGRFRCGCALGTAYLATIGNRSDGALSPDDIFNPLAEKFGVPKEILIDISFNHFKGTMNRAECADWLASKGY